MLLFRARRSYAQGHFVSALAVWHNRVHGSHHNEADYHSYHFADVWGCDDAEVSEAVAHQLPHAARRVACSQSTARVWAFFESEDFAALQ